jgi:hypothetical protein
VVMCSFRVRSPPNNGHQSAPCKNHADCAKTPRVKASAREVAIFVVDRLDPRVVRGE